MDGAIKDGLTANMTIEIDKVKAHKISPSILLLNDEGKLGIRVIKEGNLAKFVEIIIVGSTAYLVFIFLGLNYALLLSVITGLSVIVPYIGAAVVNIPIAVIAYVQWGLGGEFWTVIIAYNILQMLDGNVLVPIIFSEAVNLHPVAIIFAVLFFGGIWGLAGVFFAIPLATFIQATINAWPSRVQSKPIAD